MPRRAKTIRTDILESLQQVSQIFSPGGSVQVISAVRNRKLVTGQTKIRDFALASESEYRAAFMRFLLEIPTDFRTIAKHRDKKKLVREHLQLFYLGMPKDQEVDIVLKRVTNLAALMESGRAAIEDKASQHQFKSQQWGKVKRCALCGYVFASLEEVSLDHIISLALGGAEDPENWQLTCALCNQQKQEYWGAADISRIEMMRRSDGKFFSLPNTKVLEQLRAKSNPTRYWVLEASGRQCSECQTSAANEKLVIACSDPSYLLTFDTLRTYCVSCVKKQKFPYCE